MNKNIKIAKELVKLAKSLVANALSNEEIEKIKQYLNDFASKNGYTIKEDNFGYCLFGKAKAFCTENKQCNLKVTITFKFDENKYSISTYSDEYGGISNLIADDDKINNVENIEKNLKSNIEYIVENWESNQLFGKY